MPFLPLDRVSFTIRLSNYFAVASNAVLAYDFLLTFGEEVLSVWSKWTFIKTIYILSRYMPFVDVAIITYQQFALDLTGAQCKTAYRITGWLYVSGMALSEAVLTYRTWVLWERDKRLACGLSVFFCVLWGTGFAIMNRFVSSLTFTKLPIPFDRGCVINSASRIIWVDWALLLLYNTGTLTLMVCKASLSWSGVNSRLFNRMYRDGIHYYLCLFVVSVINVAVICFLPVTYVNLLSSTIRALHSISSNRVFFSIRKEVDRSVERDNFL